MNEGRQALDFFSLYWRGEPRLSVSDETGKDADQKKTVSGVKKGQFLKCFISKTERNRDGMHNFVTKKCDSRNLLIRQE